MKAVIQRVKKADVTVDNNIVGSIGVGLLVLVAVHVEDELEDLEWMVRKIAQLRIFSDKDQAMNLAINEVAGDILAISQFTLYASTKKGNRPSYLQSAKPDKAIPFYEQLVKKLDDSINGSVETGVFGADMKVSLINDGPVTITIDSKNKM